MAFGSKKASPILWVLQTYFKTKLSRITKMLINSSWDISMQLYKLTWQRQLTLSRWRFVTQRMLSMFLTEFATRREPVL